MPDAVERFLAGCDPEIRDLAPTLRKLVQRVAPDASIFLRLTRVSTPLAA